MCVADRLLFCFYVLFFFCSYYYYCVLFYLLVFVSGVVLFFKVAYIYVGLLFYFVGCDCGSCFFLLCVCSALLVVAFSFVRWNSFTFCFVWRVFGVGVFLGCTLLIFFLLCTSFTHFCAGFVCLKSAICFDACCLMWLRRGDILFCLCHVCLLQCEGDDFGLLLLKGILSVFVCF